jgi:hypothetical protein
VDEREATRRTGDLANGRMGDRGEGAPPRALWNWRKRFGVRKGSRLETRSVSQTTDREDAIPPGRPFAVSPTRPFAYSPIRLFAYSPIRLFAVRYPDILYLGRMTKEFFALALFGVEPVADLTVGNPGRF